jgi:hypothetical protein
MRLEINIELDNAAFQYDVNPDAPEEGQDVALPAVAHELHEIADRIQYDGRAHGIVTDPNGNRVGQFQIVGAKAERRRESRWGWFG